MTRTELIKLLQDSFADYPKIPLMAEVMVLDGCDYIDIKDLTVTIVSGEPTVILI